jgi:peptide/nickel transport system ATP-binding protein
MLEIFTQKDIRMTKKPLLTVKNLKKYFPVKSGMIQRKEGLILAVDDVSFEINEGETLGMVGESGCGKSTIGKTILRTWELTEGQVIYHFGDEELDVSTLNKPELRNAGFRRKTQMIFQDPNSSLDSRMTVLDIISEPLVANNIIPNRYEREEHIMNLMELVGLDRRYLKRYPHAFSGGQRQRISIARALSTNPQFIVADEPTSALDVSIQAQILNLMIDLQKQFSLTYLFITHNLGAVRNMSDRVAVMYLGQMVELADNQQIFESPLHPYTEALLRAVPIADPDYPSGMEAAPGEVGSPINPPSGCHFHPRCAFATDVCAAEKPVFRMLGNNHFVACHHAEDLTLDGINSRPES